MKIESPQVRDTYLNTYLDRLARQLNLASEGLISGASNAGTAAPTTGTWSQGDFVRHSTPSEVSPATPTYDQLGSVMTGKYVVFGWICVAGGAPGTWKECRFLTGN